MATEIPAPQATALASESTPDALASDDADEPARVDWKIEIINGAEIKVLRSERLRKILCG